MENHEIKSEKAKTPVSTVVGKGLRILCILFLLMDAVMKIIRENHSIQGTMDLGWPDSAVTPLGILLLIITALFIIPKTTVLGALFATAYPGGAVATMARIQVPYYFPIIFGVLIWVSIYLTVPAIRTILPVRESVA